MIKRMLVLLVCAFTITAVFPPAVAFADSCAPDGSARETIRIPADCVETKTARLGTRASTDTDVPSSEPSAPAAENDEESTPSSEPAAGNGEESTTSEPVAGNDEESTPSEPAAGDSGDSETNNSGSGSTGTGASAEKKVSRPTGSATATITDEPPNTEIKVIPSDANALVLMDAGAHSPKGSPGKVVTVVLTLAVNKE